MQITFAFSISLKDTMYQLSTFSGRLAPEMSVLAIEILSLEGQSSKFESHNEKVHQNLYLQKC